MRRSFWTACRPPKPPPTTTIRCPSGCVARGALGRSARARAAVDGLAEARLELAVARAGIAAVARGHLRRQQAGDEPVLVRRPDGAVPAQERGARALLAPEPQRAVEQALDEPLEADGHLDE